MKKSIAFIGALFMGSIAFAQVSKNDNINKTASRKVLDADVKDLPPDPEANVQIGEIKGESLEKHKGDESAAIHKGGTYKESSIQKSSDASAGTGTIKGESFDAKHPRDYKKPSDNKSTTTEKQHYTIKLTNANISSSKEKSDGDEPGVIKENGTSTQKKQDTHIKMQGDKVAKDPMTTPTTATSNQYIKIGDIKGEKDN